MEHINKAIEAMFSLTTLVSFLLVVVAVIVFVIMKRAFNRYIKHIGAEKDYGDTKARIARTIYTIARYVLVFFVVVSILGINGIDLTAIAAAAGAAGIVLGFALQDILNDLAMGVRIVTDNYFSVGQTVRVGELEGVVMAISPQSTKIRSIKDDSVTTLSNRLLTRVEVVDPTTDIDVPLSYDLSVREAERILMAAVEKIRVIENVSDCQFKGTQAFGESGILYKIRIKCSPPERYQVLRDARRIIQDVLEANGQNIPYPQLDVHQR